MKDMAKKGLLVLLFAVIATGAFAQTQGFSVGARVIGIKPFYKVSSELEKLTGSSIDIESGLRLGFAAQASYNFTDLLGVQLEVLYNSDKAKVNANVPGFGSMEVATVKANALMIPVLVRVGASLFNGIELTGVAGAYYTLALGKAEVVQPSMFGSPGSTEKDSWKGSFGAMAGAIVGYRLGPGLLFGDVRYALDFKDSEYKLNGKNEEVWKKSAIQFGIGYSILLGGYNRW